MKTRNYYFLMLLAFLFISCERNLADKSSGKKLEIYLMEEYSTLGNTKQIINTSAVLSEVPLVAYNDIIAYSKSKHVFYIDATLREHINAKSGSEYHSRAFAVTIDKEIIYTGYFWAAYSSGICDWTTIDPIDYDESGGLKVNLGYPSALYGSQIQDLRNDSRILFLVTNDGKLIK